MIFLTFLLFYLNGCLAFGRPSTTAIVGYVTPEDLQLFKRFFSSKLPNSLNEPNKLYNVILGFDALNERLEDPKKACDHFPKVITSAEGAFYRVSGGKMLGSSICQWSNPDLEKFAGSVLVDGISAEDLYFIISAMKDAGLSINTARISELIKKIKTKDSSPSTLTFLLSVVTKLDLSKASLKSYIPFVTELLYQADEFDGSLLYFDRGLYTTAMATKVISDFIVVYGETSGIPIEKLIKLVNFVYLRRHSTYVRATAHLVNALRSFSSNPVLTPIVFVNAERDPPTISPWFVSQSSPFVQLRLVSLWGDVWHDSKSLTVKASGLHNITEDGSVGTIVGSTERGAFAVSKEENRMQLSLASSDGSLPPRGSYGLLVSVFENTPNGSHTFLGASNHPLSVHVVARAKVAESYLTVRNEAHDEIENELTLKPGQLHADKIRVHSGQQLSLRLRLVEDSKEQTALTAHQVFIQLTHVISQTAVTLLCTERTGKENSKEYILKMNPDTAANDFDHLSGVYKTELIVGDPLIQHPIIWHMVDLELVFPGIPGVDTDRRASEASDESRQHLPSAAGAKRSHSRHSIVGSGPFSALPEIEHMFRKPERRPPPVVAWVFTAACVVPLLFLLISWISIGVNVRKLRFNLSNIVFHLGLIGIFGLYYCYWRHLNMFTTLGYLAVLSVPTFLAGNAVLKAQANAT